MKYVILALGLIFILAIWFVDWNPINILKAGFSVIIAVATIELLEKFR